MYESLSNGLNVHFGNRSNRLRHFVTISGRNICQSWAITRRKKNPIHRKRWKVKKRQNILKAVHTMEMHIALTCIAMGILQSISSIPLGNWNPASCVTNGCLREGECQNLLFYTIFENIFSCL